MQSTLPPGTGDYVIKPIIFKEFKKRQINKNLLKYVHSYERIMPGDEYLNSIINNWRCYGANNISASKKFRKFAEIFINTKKFPLHELKDILHSETSKILENTYRAINIAFIDEWSKFAQKNSLDLFNIILGIQNRPTHKNIMRPGLGVGGYCLTKDPSFMEYSKVILNEKKVSFKLSNLAVSVNKKMPINSIDLFKSMLKKFALLQKRNLNFYIFGLSYKPDIGDTRNSSSIIIQKYISSFSNKLYLVDPYVKKYLNF